MELLTDRLTTLIYATDASLYRYMPEAVAKPTDNIDIISLINYAKNNCKSLTFRAAGTSLAGQTLTNSIAVDVSKNWKQLEVLDNGKAIRAGISVIGAKLNQVLSPYNRKFGPDPASINSAMIGGILANNSGGLSCGTLNNSYSTMLGMTFILSNGIEINSLEADADDKLKLTAPLTYQKLIALKEEILNNNIFVDKIKRKYELKNTIGYSLNSFLDFEKPIDILTHLLIGSEGTLGFISEATFKTVPLNKFKKTYFLSFSSAKKLSEAIKVLKSYGAEALEFMDSISLDSVASKIINILDFDLTNKFALLAEFGFENELDRATFELKEDSVFNKINFEDKFSTLLHKEQYQLWAIRKGLLASIGGQKKPNTSFIIEDVAVRIDDLSDALSDIRNLINKYDFNTGIYGHGIDGNIHFTISENFSSEKELNKLESFFKDLTDLIVDRFDGSLKAEHGTGRNMSPFVEKEWGSQLYSIMHQVKSAIDPDGIFNYGVLLNDDYQIHLKNIKSIPDVSPIVDKCIECGFCEVVCPSKNTTLTPRQRIALHREIVRMDLKLTVNEEKQIKNLFDDTCATDGLCSITCPVGINTGLFVKSHRFEKEDESILEHIEFKTIEKVAKFGIKSKALLKNSIFHYIAKLSQPNMNFDLIVNLKHKPINLEFNQESKPIDYIYFPTCTSRLFGSGTQKENIVEKIMDIGLLFNLNIVILEELAGKCCGLMYESKGMLNLSNVLKNYLTDVLAKFNPKAVVIDSESCYGYLKNDNQNVNFIDTFDFLNLGRENLQITNEKILFHPSCSTRLLLTDEEILNKLKNLGINADLTELRCCGAAGDKVFLEKELYQSAAIEFDYLKDKDYVGYYSNNLPCEISLSHSTGKIFQSLVYLVKNVEN